MAASVAMKARRSRESDDTGPRAKSPRLIVELNGDRMGGLVIGRIRTKTPLRGTAQESSEGKFFSFVLTDTSGEINVVCSDNAENLYEQIQVGKGYKITGFYLRKPSSSYRVTSHEYELRLTKINKMEEVERDDLPEIAPEYITVAEILKIPANKPIDLIGVVYRCCEPQTYLCRDGVSRTKRNVLIVDESKRIVTLSLWGEHSTLLGESEGQTAAIQNVVVREYGGKRQLTSTSSTVVVTEKNPDDPTLCALQAWWNEEGHEEEFEELIIPTAE